VGIVLNINFEINEDIIARVMIAKTAAPDLSAMQLPSWQQAMLP